MTRRETLYLGPLRSAYLDFDVSIDQGHHQGSVLLLEVCNWDCLRTVLMFDTAGSMLTVPNRFAFR